MPFFFASVFIYLDSSSSAIEFMLLKTGVKEWMDKMQNSWLSFLLHIWPDHPEPGIIVILFFPFQISIPNHWFPVICLLE